MDVKEIEKKVMANLMLDHVIVNTNDGSHFDLIAVGDLFGELNRVRRQQVIYEQLSDDITNNRIHALSIKTYTLLEWEKQRKLMGF